MSLMADTAHASQACTACRRLKRKCTKELPSCSLCVRLNKECQYQHTGLEELDRESLIAVVRQLRERLEQGGRQPTTPPGAPSPAGANAIASAHPAVSNPHIGAAGRHLLPSAFFLDPDFHSPIPQIQGTPGLPAPLDIGGLIGDDVLSVCRHYFATTHTWFPLLSPKHLYQRVDGAIRDADIALLVLCMKLISEPDGLASPADNLQYSSARHSVGALEDASVLSTSLLQSIVLIALYEAGHGLFPAAYLTVGRAARLGTLMGLHCRDPQGTTQLYKSADSCTMLEESRRAWWAILILDRYLNLGPKGLLLSTPEPNRGDLLPFDDEKWNRGEIGPSHPVYTSRFSKQSQVGPFARTCQSAHMLGSVLRHRDERHLDRSARLDEALQLHSALTALDSHLVQALDVGCEDGTIAVNPVDLALCCSARLTLYNMYSCNETVGDPQDRVPQESDMQAHSLEGIRTIAGERVPKALARTILQRGGDAALHKASPLIIQCLYHAATECQWFIREGLGPEMETALQLITDALALLVGRWRVAGMYLQFLETSP